MLIGAISGAVFAGIGNAFAQGGRFSGTTWFNTVTKSLTAPGRILKTTLHGFAGGVRSVLSGGTFKAGFASAGFTQAVAPLISHVPGGAGQLVAAGVVGGLGSRLAGGDFEAGFVTGVFSHGFNHGLHPDDGLRGDPEFLKWDGDPNNGMAIATTSPLDFIGGGIARGVAWLGRGIGRMFSPQSSLFRNEFYGYGDAGALNKTHIRIGWSYNKSQNQLEFALRVGQGHGRWYNKPIKIIKPPPPMN